MCTGAVRTVVQTPIATDGHRQNWKCEVDYYNGDKRFFVLPSPSLKARLTHEEAREGVENLQPQPFTSK